MSTHAQNQSSALGWFNLYRELAKSGIVTLVVISVLGGYLIGHPFEQNLDLYRLFLTLIGILLMASGSSALNQLQEVAIDEEMPRTAKRPLPSGRISRLHAWIFVVTTLIVGLAILWRIDPRVFALGVLAVVSYNGFYTLWWKRRWAFAAIPGAIPGALPILMGYAAAAGQTFTPAGIYLFAILFFWQMPHFWVLALRFQDDYAQGGIPTLPVARGETVTVHQIRLWCLGYVALVQIAPLFLAVGGFYCVIATLMSAWIMWELRIFVQNYAADETPGAGTASNELVERRRKAWLRFFLWINFSLIAYLALAALDLWSIYLVRFWTDLD